MRVIVPAIPAAEGRKSPVNVQVGSDTAKPMELLARPAAPGARAPRPRAARPATGSSSPAAASIPSPPGNVVTFSGQPALVLAASRDGADGGGPGSAAAKGTLNAEVRVRAKGTESTSAAPFVLTRASRPRVFVPRFYAAPVTEYPTEDLAFVSSEIGPAPAVSAARVRPPSTAERARPGWPPPRTPRGRRGQRAARASSSATSPPREWRSWASPTCSCPGDRRGRRRLRQALGARASRGPGARARGRWPPTGPRSCRTTSACSSCASGRSRCSR